MIRSSGVAPLLAAVPTSRGSGVGVERRAPIRGGGGGAVPAAAAAAQAPVGCVMMMAGALPKPTALAFSRTHLSLKPVETEITQEVVRKCKGIRVSILRRGSNVCVFIKIAAFIHGHLVRLMSHSPASQSPREGVQCMCVGAQKACVPAAFQTFNLHQQT